MLAFRLAFCGTGHEKLSAVYGVWANRLCATFKLTALNDRMVVDDKYCRPNATG